MKKKPFWTEPAAIPGEPVFTMFEVEYINFSHNEGDYMLCRNMEAVFEHLKEIEHILDENPEDEDSLHSVRIHPVAMTKAQYISFCVAGIESDY